MKKIKLTQNKFSLIDDEDFEEVNKYKWCFDKSINYAIGRVNGKNIRLHRFILKPQIKEHIDHINRKHLDNRKSNLRICTKSDNGANRPKQKNNTSGYKGVFLIKDSRKKKYMARLKCKNEDIFIGYFYTKKQAAQAYNLKAKELFGKFALLNKI